jgi:hypothetical protein
MSDFNENQILRELQNDATKWIMKTLPVRTNSGQVNEVEARMKLKDEADQWVQDSLKQRLDGKEALPFPS